MEMVEGLSALEQRQQLLAHHVRMVARKLSHSLLIYGYQPGLGKTRTTLNALREENIDPILINSHVTPLALYSLFYQHREEAVLFMDDVDSIFTNLPALGILRSALWGNPRIITYNSSQLSATGLPASFEFSSRVIFCVNRVPKNNDCFSAVVSRCDVFCLEATSDEIIDLMRSVASQGFQGIPAADCNTVIDFLAENAEDHEISMRLLGPSLRKWQYARAEGLDWRALVKSQLQTLGRKQQPTKRLDTRGRDLRLLREARKRHPESVKDQMTDFCTQTKKSRASFYRTLARLREEV